MASRVHWMAPRRRHAIRHGQARKGYWHMAKTIASGVGTTNAWLQEQGLVSQQWHPGELVLAC